MRVFLQKNKAGSTTSIWLVLFIALAVSIFFLTIEKRPYLALGSAVAGIGLTAFVTVLVRLRPLLIIDEFGVFDARLGVPKISWRDIEDVQIEIKYGNRFLCFKVRDPERYLGQMSPSQREKIVFNHGLGFKRFNVDMKNIEANLLELKREIDSRINLNSKI